METLTEVFIAKPAAPCRPKLWPEAGRLSLPDFAKRAATSASFEETRQEIAARELEFENRFLRCRGLLFYIAVRILKDQQTARLAVGNCWRTASRSPLKFPYEGDFRSWLLRILIDESVAIRECRQDR
jgi:hypothetical protein